MMAKCQGVPLEIFAWGRAGISSTIAIPHGYNASMTPAQFIAKWKPVELKERSACQEHFLDLCAVLEQKTPAAADPKGEWYCFEKGVTKDSGGQGFADVWRRGCFGWEYKGKRKDLSEALVQLQRYREALENPPLLIVCDMDRFEIHTNFNDSIKTKHAFDLDDLAEPKYLSLLRNAFADPQSLNPKLTQAKLTESVAESLRKVADHLRHNLTPIQKADPEAANQRIAHFLMKCIFCMFAEDTDLLPKNLFTNMLRAHDKKRDATERDRLERAMASLFTAMAGKNGLLQSRSHVLWSLKQGTQLEDRPRYTPSTSVETFPFPRPTKAQEQAIAAAAKDLDTLRNNWLNPPEWTRTETLEFPGSVDGPWKRYVTKPNVQGIGTVKYPRLVPEGSPGGGVAEGPHAHQALQRTPRMASQRPPHAGRSRLCRLRLEPRSDGRRTAGEAAGVEPGTRRRRSEPEPLAGRASEGSAR
ncbi:hypothetical protein BH11PLA2_BH11PLA2_03900 [soil metagenome]